MAFKKRHRSSTRKVDGYPVVDADKPLEVHVTQRDIDRGKPDACACAFVVALKREYGSKHCRVNATRTYVEKGGVLLRFRTPGGIFQQIELFDHTGDMGPGVYTIPVMPPAQRLDAPHKVYKWHASTTRLPPLAKRARPVYRIEEESER
jgi:hypothetical protein